MAKANAVKNASLTADFLKGVKQVLIEEKTKLEKELVQFAKKDPHAAEADYDATFPNYGDKEEDNAQEVAEYAANLSIEHDLEKSLRDVNSSLERLGDGTYGTCKYCKKPIDKKRLLARPTSSACIECKKTIRQEV